MVKDNQEYPNLGRSTLNIFLRLLKHHGEIARQIIMRSHWIPFAFGPITDLSKSLNNLESRTNFGR